VTKREAAEALRNVNLYVDRGALPPAEDGEFYHADLIGLGAVAADGTMLGKVTAIHNFGAGDIIELQLKDGGTTLLAFDELTVPQIDIAGGRIVVQLPAETEVREANAETSQ
jgi:16S rRNA processing protein RimM